MNRLYRQLTCPTEEQILLHIHRALPLLQHLAVMGHLFYCTRCQEKLQQNRAISFALGSALARPGQRHFPPPPKNRGGGIGKLAFFASLGTVAVVTGLLHFTDNPQPPPVAHTSASNRFLAVTMPPYSKTCACHGAAVSQGMPKASPILNTIKGKLECQ